jgi:predicted ribosome quality control (RQC) complex YloA/Tae2 family protein
MEDMMASLDGLSLSTLLNELNTKLTGGRIDKIFQPDKYTLILWIRQTNENLRLLISANPKHPRIHLTEATLENPATPPAFCMLLRKHLEGGRIAGIIQHSLDRIALISIDFRGEDGAIVTKYLTVELMGKHSNIILTQNHIIIDAIKRIGTSISRSRQVLPRMEYTYPPGQMRLNLLTTPVSNFINTLIALELTLVTKGIIQTAIGIGPITAKEIVWRAGLPANITIDSLDNADIVALGEATESIITQLKAEKSTPTVIVTTDNQLTGIASFKLEHLTQKHTIYHFSTMSEAVEFTDNLTGKKQLPEQAILSRLVTDESNRLQRKQLILKQELVDATAADSYREYADILMANLYTIPEGEEKVTLTNLYSDTPTDNQVTIDFDTRLSPLENAQSYYTKYNKLKRAQELLREQLSQCIQEISYLESITVALEHATNSPELADIREELINSGYLKRASKRRMPIPASSPLTAITPDGLTILIGKNNRQNDLVTFKQAQHNDLWFHTKDIPGSHVILRSGTQNPSQQAIEAAAYLAAYYSKASQSSNVPVDYTKRRYVKKPSGAKPGFVIYDHQSTIYITPDEKITKALLKK